MHHIFGLTSLIDIKCNINKENIYCAFIDFRKAFDAIDRHLLFGTLYKNQIHGNILELIKSMYTETNNVIRLNGVFTEEFESKKGVAQGNNLSPTLSSIYINSLLEELHNSKIGVNLNLNPTKSDMINVLAYADDIVLLAETPNELKQLLKIVENWCKTWQINVNTSKMKIIHFRQKGKHCTKEKFDIGGNEIEMVDEYKYLGIWLHCNLDISVTMQNLALGGSRALSQIIGKLKDHREINYETFTTLFHSMVCPILDYGGGAWNTGYDCKKLDQIQQRACHYFSGLPRTAPISGLEGDMGWTPGVVRRDLDSVRLFNEFIRMHQDRLTYRIYRLD